MCFRGVCIYQGGLCYPGEAAVVVVILLQWQPTRQRNNHLMQRHARSQALLNASVCVCVNAKQCK